MNRRFPTTIVGLALLAASCSSSAKDATPTTAPPTTLPLRPPNTVVAVPKVTGPVTGGEPDVAMNAMPAALATRYGYTEREYFLEGTARSYRPEGTWGAGGRWEATPAATAPFKTRIIVRVPEDRARFNGTVVFEWLNVTAGMDSDPVFGFMSEELLRSGYAYVGVTAQKGGVDGGGLTIPIEGFDPQPLVRQNAARYRGLQHPGDDYSYDIFSQAAQAVLAPNGPKPLGDLQPVTLLAVGESQSAFRLVTYVNAVSPLTHIYDGFLLHSRGGSPAPLSEGSSAPNAARIRDDLGTPVLTLITETDLVQLGFEPARQPDGPMLRTWEVAGTAHADQHTLDYGIASGQQWNPGAAAPDFGSMCGRINDGPQIYLVRAAIAALRTWVVDERTPASAPPLTFAAGTIARDEHGNARGGVRTPAVDVPVSTLSGEAPAGRSIICSLFGVSEPFDAATLRALYPTHADYVAKVKTAAAGAARRGFLLPADEALVVAEAERAPIPA